MGPKNDSQVWIFSYYKWVVEIEPPDGRGHAVGPRGWIGEHLQDGDSGLQGFSRNLVKLSLPRSPFNTDDVTLLQHMINLRCRWGDIKCDIWRKLRHKIKVTQENCVWKKSWTFIQRRRKKTHYVTSHEGNIVDIRSLFEEVKSDLLLFTIFSRLIVLRFQAYL